MGKKKLFVIGNGFDLYCGLNTRWSDFYDNVCKQNINALSNSLIPIRQKSLLIDKHPINLIGYLLYCYSLGKSSINWSDVEEILNDIITCKENKWRVEMNKIYNCILSSTFYARSQYPELLGLIISKCYKKENPSLSYLLMNELNKFENDFKNYLNSEVKRIEQTDDFKIKRSGLRNKLGIDDSSFILNFNYTSVKNDNRTNPKFNEINIHGNLKDDNIIIGIDYTNCDPKDKDSILFSKTYRKLNNLSTIHKQILTNNISEICFFGHSLGEQDYSYFQSIFDFYDIYNKNIKLNFYYTDNYVHTAKEKNEIKTKYVEAIFSMINKYGETLDNKNHGKNLLHKLMLEDRISIINIEDLNSEGNWMN